MSVSRKRRSAQDVLDDVTIAHLYRRVSSDEQADEGLSLGTQATNGRSWVAHQPRMMIGGEYEDVESGRHDDRAEYQRMLAAIRAQALEGRRQLVVVPRLDRFGRKVSERVRAYEELKALGVAIYSLGDGGHVSEVVYNIMAAIAQEETRQLGERVREVYRQLERGGWHLPGKVAWGYRLRSATDDERRGGAPKQVLDVDDVTAPYLREAWRRYADGESARGVATWIAGLPSVARGGRNLGSSAVRQVLSNPTYVGRHGTADDDPDEVVGRPRGRWPALIEDEIWLRAAAYRARAARMPNQASGDYPLTGLLRCSRCGGRMGGRMRSDDGGRRVRRRDYMCEAGIVLGADNTGSRCSYVVPADAVETAVYRDVAAMLAAAGEPTVRPRVTRAITDAQRAGLGEPVERQIDALERDKARILVRLDRLTDRLADGVLDAAEYARHTGRYRDELDRIAEELRTLRGRAPRSTTPTPITALLGVCADMAPKLAGASPSKRRDLYALLVERMTAVRIGRGSYVMNYAPTVTGRVILAASIAALSERTGAEARELHERLVEIEQIASPLCSTSTIAGLDLPPTVLESFARLA